MVKQVNKAKRAKKGKRAKNVEDIKDVERNGKERILIVDDDEGICKSLSLILGRKGYETEIAGTGQEALEKARKGIFDLALLDIRLPDMEGVDLLEPLKEMHPDMPMVMITAYASTETAMRALNGQAVAYITKPLDIDEMLARIEEILEKERLIREKRQTEEALRESEERYRVLAENVTDVIFTADVNMRTTYVSPSITLQRGYTVEETMMHTFEEMMPPYSIPIVTKAFAEALAAEEAGEGPSSYSLSLELELYCKDGSTMWAEIRGSFVRNSEGQVVEMLGVVRDINERKRAEEALRESEERYRAIFESASDAIFTLHMTDEGPRFADYNTNALKLYGCKREELLGASPLDFSPSIQPDGSSSAESVAEIEVAAMAGEPQYFEWRHCRLDGTLFDAEVAVSRIDLRGERYLQAMVRDITERRKAEQALRDSEERFRTLIENSSDVIAITGRDGTLMYESPSVERVLGYEAEEKLGKSLFEMIHPDDRQSALESYGGFVSNPGAIVVQNMRLPHKDGSWRMVEAVSKNLLDDSKIRGVVTNYRDITERKEAERAVRESEERMRSLFENSPDFIMEVDPDFKILFINHTLPEFTIEETIGTSVLDYTTIEEQDSLKEALNYVFETGMPARIETKGVGPEGRTSWYETRLGPIAREGEVATAMLIAADVTERQEAEEELNVYRDHLEELVEERTTELQARTSELEQVNTQLQEADRLKSIFLASMSHELRTPLNSIIGFTGIILQGMVGELNEEQRRQLTMVKSSASHLLELINDLLDVSRVEAGRVDLWLEEFSLNDVVREVAETCLPMVNEKGLDFDTEVPENVILFSDRRRVKQILMNFASNAIKFSERGSIKITARVLEGEKLEMRVADTGIGIEKDNIDRLFKPFQQVDMSLPKRYGGSGLGLYLSKKLADLLGGDVWAESEYGVGSEFSFALPLKYEECRRDEEEDTSG